MVNFMPNPTLPLGEREVRVSRDQFSRLGLLAERHMSGLISEGEYVIAAMDICPELKPDGVVNKLVVEDLPRTGPKVFS